MLRPIAISGGVANLRVLRDTHCYFTDYYHMLAYIRLIARYGCYRI